MLIYQLLPRLFGNRNSNCIPHGTIEENGVGKFADINLAALTSIKHLSVTHIWLTGILEHASTSDYSARGISPIDCSLVKGKAGSPYAIMDYYDVSPDLAQDVPRRMSEFEHLVERCHKVGLKVMIDFVPNHLFRQYASDAKPLGITDFGANDDQQLDFSPSNNFYYLNGAPFVSPVRSDYQEEPAKATGNDCFLPDPGVNDWYETVKLNYGVDYMHGHKAHFEPIPDTWLKMLDVLSFWADKGVDGFRCDMAEMVPAPFWAWVIPRIKSRKSHLIFIAEIYKTDYYPAYLKSGFDFLYDKVGLYDTLRAVLQGARPASDISPCWQHLGNMQPAMLNFLENHDEQRIASDFFVGNPFKAIPALVVSACLNTAPFLLYAGQEFGEKGMDNEGFSGVDGRTSIFDYWSVDTLRRYHNDGLYNLERFSDVEKKLYHLYIKLFALLSSSPAIAFGATHDLVYANQNNVRFNPNKHFAFLRHSKRPKEETLLIAVNFSDQPADMDIHIPKHAFEHLEIQDQRLVCGRVLFCTDDEVFPKTRVLFSSTSPVPVHLLAFGAVIIDIEI